MNKKRRKRMVCNLSKKANEKIQWLIKNHKKLISYYTVNIPFKIRSYQLHFRTIQMRNAIHNSNNIGKRFASQLHKALISWDLKKRGAKLLEEDKFISLVIDNKNLFKKYWNLQIEEMEDRGDKVDIGNGLASLIYQEIRIMENESQLIGGSKFLHHILPELVSPVDLRMKTMFNLQEDPKCREKTFLKAFLIWSKIAKGIISQYKNSMKFKREFLFKFKNKDAFSVIFGNSEIFIPISISIPKFIDDIIIAAIDSKEYQRIFDVSSRKQRKYKI